MKYHYTYLIQSKTSNMRYIGVRTSNVLPINDITYWGSSKHLPENVKETHKKLIIKEFSTRKDAVEHEISLHNLNNVAICVTFYNKAKQTSTGFDTTGMKITEKHKESMRKKLKTRIFTKEHREKIVKSTKGVLKTEQHKKNCSIAQKKYTSQPGYINPRKGVTLSSEIRKKVSESIKRLGCSKGINNSNFKPWFITHSNVTHLFYDITKDEQSIKDGYVVATYRRLYTRSKGKRTMKNGKFKGLIVGNIPI